MTDQEYHDLLIRLDTRQANIEKKVDKIEAKLESPLPCGKNTEKIKTMERFLWGAWAAVLTALIKVFWPGGAQ